MKKEKCPKCGNTKLSICSFGAVNCMQCGTFIRKASKKELNNIGDIKYPWDDEVTENFFPAVEKYGREYGAGLVICGVVICVLGFILALIGVF